MNISIVIVTYKRSKELEKCLGSILLQNIQPKEVIVIDNAKDLPTKLLIENKKELFQKNSISLLYIENPREDSLSVARNVGINLSVGKIISFVDDDVILGKDYHEKIMQVFKDYPEALAVQGYVQNAKENFSISQKDKNILSKLIEWFYKIFQINTFFEENKCRVLPSLCVTYPYPSINKIINCEWLAGCAAVYKREVLEEFNFDEKLKRFSWCIDQDHPYRIFKKHPNSLFLTPFAKYWHNPSKEGRLPNKDLIYLVEICDLYVFYKIIDQNFKNKLRYAWRKTGKLFFRRILFNLITLGWGKPKEGFLKIKYSIGAIICCLRHLKEIKRGDLDFFNKTLK